MASGSITVQKGGDAKAEKVTFTRTGGMCPRCEGRGTVSDIDLRELYDETISIDDGAIRIPGYSMEGWYGRIFRGCGYFDTTSGHKRDPDSYRLIADRLDRQPADVLFLSDVVEELDAAREAGMRTVLLDRREDYPEPRTGDATNGHPRVESFAEIAP